MSNKIRFETNETKSFWLSWAFAVFQPRNLLFTKKIETNRNEKLPEIIENCN